MDDFDRWVIKINAMDKVARAAMEMYNQWGYNECPSYLDRYDDLRCELCRGPIRNHTDPKCPWLQFQVACEAFSPYQKDWEEQDAEEEYRQWRNEQRRLRREQECSQ